MELRTIAEVPYDDERLVARVLLEAEHANARVIRLNAGQALPPHSHGASDLFLYVVEGRGTLTTPEGPAPLEAGSLAHLRGDEELRVASDGGAGLTLLAVLAPAFPPRRS